MRREMTTIPIPPETDNLNFLNKTAAHRWGVTIATVLIALALTEVLWLMVDRPVTAPLFLVAIVLTTWLCGFQYGAAAVLISGIVIDLCFVQPRFEFSASRDELMRLLIFVFEGTAISWLVARLRQAGEDIRTSHRKLTALTDYQQRLREDEQKRIAREVHDELGQALTSLKMRIHLLKTQSIPHEASDRALSKGFEDLMQITDETISTVRRIASELRPSILDDFGLVPAIEWQTQEFSRKTSIPCKFSTNCEDIDLGHERNTAMYRIVQEALTNVARHAKASKVTVGLDVMNNGASVYIQDDGVGMEERNRRGISFGIIGMQERSRMIGGELEIRSEPSNGTEINLRFPLDAEQGAR